MSYLVRCPEGFGHGSFKTVPVSWIVGPNEHAQNDLDGAWRMPVRCSRTICTIVAAAVATTSRSVRLVSVDTAPDTDGSHPTPSVTGTQGCRDQGVASPDLIGRHLDAGSDGRERNLHAPQNL
jgi:hypothetical protein